MNDVGRGANDAIYEQRQGRRSSQDLELTCCHNTAAEEVPCRADASFVLVVASLLSMFGGAMLVLVCDADV